MKYLIQFFLVCIFFKAIDGAAFTLDSSNNPNYRGWANSEIQFVVNKASCPASVDIEGLLNASFEVWHKIPSTHVKLKLVGQTTSTTHGYPVVVYCETNMGAIGLDENSIPAAASTTKSGDYAATGLMYINASAAGLASVTRLDRNSTIITLAHEVGHIFGLGHSHDTSALMYFDGSVKTVLSLNQDDIDGVTYLYPANEIGADKPLGCGLVKSIQKPRVPPQALLMILLLFALPLATSIYLRRPKNKNYFVDCRKNYL